MRLLIALRLAGHTMPLTSRVTEFSAGSALPGVTRIAPPRGGTRQSRPLVPRQARERCYPCAQGWLLWPGGPGSVVASSFHEEFSTL